MLTLQSINQLCRLGYLLNEWLKIKDVKSIDDIRKIEVFFLGKKGKVQELYKQIKELSETERKTFGENVNNLRAFIENEIKEKELEISLRMKEEKLLSEKLDVTLPGFSFDIGRKHILNKVIDEVKSIALR